MARVDHLYPASPHDVPENLTSPSADYQTRMLLVLFSVIVFFGVYMMMLFGTALMIPLSLLVLNIFGIPFCLFFVFFFLFLVKGFFKGSKPEKTFRIEITAEEHPKLFAFIEKLCEETGASLPGKVYLSPDVNAMVFTNATLLNFFWPGPKNLLIGMGLVNMLNLSEFKAVLAHEFGHFSQKSTRLGRYVGAALGIIGDMVYGRDWFDRMIAWMCSTPIVVPSRGRNGGGVNPIALLGWVCYGVMWVFRKVLEGAFWGIIYLHNSLSRQMEFNADLVAVSVTGSDAIVNALSRTTFASNALNQAVEDLRVASHHDLFTADIFYHQKHAAAYLRRIQKDPHLGEPPPLPEDPECSPDVFDEDDEEIPEMWSTHPSCYDRELNAKAIYIRCDLDERSPWVLFDDPEELRERLSRKFYKLVFNLPREVDLDQPGVVQQFIDDEHAETNYDPRYYGMYDGRPINPGKLDELEETVREKPWTREVLARMYARLWSGEIKEHMTEYTSLREEMDELQRIKSSSESEEETFRFRGRRYEVGEAGKLIKQVQRELEEKIDYLAAVDSRAFRVMYQMAMDLGDDVADDLLYRYEFHLAAQAICRDIQQQQPPLQAALNFMSRTGSQLSAAQFSELRGIFRDAHDALIRAVTLADKMKLPALKNMEEGEPLGHFLLERQVVKGLKPTAQTLTGKWVQKFLQQISIVLDRIRRIHFKSLGGILALQEDIGKKWLAKYGPGAPAQPARAAASAQATKPAARTPQKKA